VHALGGYRVQGKGEAAAQRLKDDALALQSAGATMIVLEAIPAALAAEVTASLAIITIGIGAGKDCSGQVMVVHDMPSTSRRARRPASSATSWTARRASPTPPPRRRRRQDGSYPAPEHTYIG
jgi:3-methyl-2-oxobutanoate hydroxymethyltransferase